MGLKITKDYKKSKSKNPLIMRVCGQLPKKAKGNFLISSLVTRTISSICKVFGLINTRFFILIRFYVRSRFSPAPFCYADFGSVRQPAYLNTVLSMHIVVSSYKSDSSKTYFFIIFAPLPTIRKKFKRRLNLIRRRLNQAY